MQLFEMRDRFEQPTIELCRGYARGHRISCSHVDHDIGKASISKRQDVCNIYWSSVM